MSNGDDQFMRTGSRYLRRRSRIYTVVLTLLGIALVAAPIGMTLYPVPYVSETYAMYAISGVAGVMTVGVWMYAFSVGRGILNPLDHLRSEALKLEYSGFDIDLDTRRADEIGDMNRAFTELSYTVSDRMQNIESVLRETSQFTNDVSETAETFTAFGETARVANEDISEAVLPEDVDSLMDNRDGETDNAEKKIQLGAEASFSSLQELNETVAELDKTTQLLHQAATDTNYLAVNAGVEAAELEGEIAGFTEATDEIQELATAISDSVDNLEDVHTDVRDVITELIEELLRQQMILAHALSYHGENLDEKADELHEKLVSLQEEKDT